MQRQQIYLLTFVTFFSAVMAGKIMKSRKLTHEIEQYHSLNPSFRKPTFMRYVSNKRYTPGTDVILPCMTSGIRPMSYTWRKNGREIIGKVHRLKFAYNRSMLKIKRVRDTDVGVYTCTSSNPYGNLSYSFNVRTKAKRKQPIFYDINTMMRKRVVVRPTSHFIKFDCQAEAQGNVHYIWLKNGKPFKHIKPRPREETSRMHLEGELKGGDLMLRNLKVNDGGQYTCVAFNRHGNVSFTYELRILRKLSGGPPKVIPYTRPQTIHAESGDNVTFECLEIISVTLPDVRWFHIYNVKNRSILPDIQRATDWNDIKSNTIKLRREYISANHYTSFKLRSANNKPKNEYLYDDTDPSGLRLILTNVNTDDSGAYSCYVSNFEGSDHATFYLKVAPSAND